MQQSPKPGAGFPPATHQRVRRAANEASPDADATIMRLAAGFYRANRRIDDLEERIADLDDDVANRLLIRACKQVANIAIATMSTPAKTAAGALAKLEVAAAWFYPETVDSPDDGAPITHHADTALVMIAGELRSLGLTSATIAPAQNLSEHRRPDADAKLFDLVAKFRRRASAFAKLSVELHVAFEDDLGSAILEEIERRRRIELEALEAAYRPIGRTPALTPEGVLAKLTVAAEEMAATPAGMDRYSGDLTPGYVIASAVADAVTLCCQGTSRQAQAAVIREALGLCAQP